jgi:hypothetical protein
MFVNLQVIIIVRQSWGFYDARRRLRIRWGLVEVIQILGYSNDQGEGGSGGKRKKP